MIQPAIRLRNLEQKKALLATLVQQFFQQHIVVLLEMIGIWQNPVFDEFVDRAENFAHLNREVFWRVDIIGGAGGDQERATGFLLGGDNGGWALCDHGLASYECGSSGSARGHRKFFLVLSLTIFMKKEQ